MIQIAKRKYRLKKEYVPFSLYAEEKELFHAVAYCRDLNEIPDQYHRHLSDILRSVVLPRELGCCICQFDRIPTKFVLHFPMESTAA